MSVWPTVLVGDVTLRVTKGTTPPAGSFVSSGVAYIKVESINDAGLIDHQKLARISESTHQSLARSILQQQDVLFTIAGSIGRAALVHESLLPANTNQAVAIVRPNTELISPRFLYYSLRDSKRVQQATSRIVQSVQSNLSLGELAALELALPSLREQQAIAEVLGALDDKIAANTRLAATADELADAQFRSLRSVTTRSDAVYDDVAVVGGGGTPSTSTPTYWSGDIPWATPTDITSLTGLVLSHTARTISETGLAACASPLYPAGTVLMTSRATIGAFAVAGVPLAVNQGFITVQSRGEVPNLWLLHEMRSRVEEFISWANGATFLELSRGNFRKLPIMTSSPEVMASFAQSASPLHATAANAIAENRTLAATRDALLPKLMSGQLRIKVAVKIAKDVGA